ncbi:AAA family ATPase [Actinoplanes sp. NBC_00393]|uniref:AAA family ATPase n=1 Tax=Actinoplanes sp. NBC_00393 TaxID=2975953 RepID=UPI002E1C43E8
MLDRFPVLWLCGPSGVGKSTIAWELFNERPGAAHVDIDQLGMCYPEIPSDPGRTILEARILGQVAANYAAAGATSLIVSGYIDSHRGIHTEHLTGVELTVLRLRCDQPEHRRRLVDRARPGEEREAALRAGVVLDRSGLPYPVLDTTGRTAADVLAEVRERWPFCPSRQPGDWPQPAATPGEIIFVCGAPAVGKSTFGWELAERFRRDGHTTGFVDLQQIGFGHDHRLKAANLAAVHTNFSAYGAQRLVVVGRIENPDQLKLYRDALPAARITVYRLHAGPDQLRERIRQRGLGYGPPIIGDELRGQPADVLAAAHEDAVAQAEKLERLSFGDVRVEW